MGKVDFILAGNTELNTSLKFTLKVGSCNFEYIIFLLIYFLNCRKALLQGSK